VIRRTCDEDGCAASGHGEQSRPDHRPPVHDRAFHTFTELLLWAAFIRGECLQTSRCAKAPSPPPRQTDHPRATCPPPPPLPPPTLTGPQPAPLSPYVPTHNHSPATPLEIASTDFSPQVAPAPNLGTRQCAFGVFQSPVYRQQPSSAALQPVHLRGETQFAPSSMNLGPVHARLEASLCPCSTHWPLERDPRLQYCRRRLPQSWLPATKIVTRPISRVWQFGLSLHETWLLRDNEAYVLDALCTTRLASLEPTLIEA